MKEIQSSIEKSGFYPLSAGAATGTVNTKELDEGHVDSPASALMAKKSGGAGTGLYGYPQYKTYDGFQKESNGDPKGYCLTTTTDGNANS